MRIPALFGEPLGSAMGSAHQEEPAVSAPKRLFNFTTSACGVPVRAPEITTLTFCLVLSYEKEIKKVMALGLESAPIVHVRSGVFNLWSPPTNPFVSTAVPQAAMQTNPFQANGGGAAAASFGPGSMSMPAGFGNSAAYNLPTSFSGNFQQPFPGQSFPQPQAYTQQQNGGGFASFGQGKAVVPQYGQHMAATGVTSNPFLAGASVAQFPTGNFSTNPFL
ncbi:arf-GAP domain and FG repeat-containing protein 1-like [Trichomycterus rosablanca]|uniref:arf-GAP domain and FG repeat-containing protein 1-like n=1 Tax=Trichomycterus rosablanca TaxID=2290929 RepID=UPI002F34FC75